MKKKPEYNGLDIIQSDNIIIKYKGKVTETDECIFWGFHNNSSTQDRKRCKINKELECSYGLTDIRTPKDCPLRKGIIRVSRKFEWVETDL